MSVFQADVLQRHNLEKKLVNISISVSICWQSFCRWRFLRKKFAGTSRPSRHSTTNWEKPETSSWSWRMSTSNSVGSTSCCKTLSRTIQTWWRTRMRLWKRYKATDHPLGILQDKSLSVRILAESLFFLMSKLKRQLSIQKACYRHFISYPITASLSWTSAEHNLDLLSRCQKLWTDIFFTDPRELWKADERKTGITGAEQPDGSADPVFEGQSHLR